MSPWALVNYARQALDAADVIGMDLHEARACLGASSYVDEIHYPDPADQRAAGLRHCEAGARHLDAAGEGLARLRGFPATLPAGRAEVSGVLRASPLVDVLGWCDVEVSTLREALDAARTALVKPV